MSIKGGANMNELIKMFLEFRSQFSKREWQEINHIIESQLNRKAAELKLDDRDLQKIENVLKQRKIMK